MSQAQKELNGTHKFKSPAHFETVWVPQVDFSINFLNNV